jgi:D-sedoheptulose 7-phosphate isomerase
MSTHPMHDIASPPVSAVVYSKTLAEFLLGFDWTAVDRLADRIMDIWTQDRQLFVCGNGGSAANAMHLANDLLYGIAPARRGLRVECLCANPSVLTCLANDEGYDQVFALQLRTKAQAGDGLIVFSGSGNSGNVLHAIREAKTLGVWTCAVVGFKGGASIHLADTVIHFPIEDMEMAEDLQMVLSHSLKRILRQRGMIPEQKA